MKKNKTNYDDIVYYNNKNEIVFNIYNNIKDEEFIPLPNNDSNNNNNDTLNFIINIFLFLESIIYSLYQSLINFLPSLNRFFYKTQYIFLIISLLFTFVYSFEDNSNISTNLIYSAYFKNSGHLTYIKYDNVVFNENRTQEIQKRKNIKSKNKNKINNKNDIDKTIDCENKYISEDLKSLMSSSANPKNTYVNYEKKINNKLINKDEIYLFIIPIKTLFFSLISLIFLFFFIKMTYRSKFRCSFIFNIFFLFIIYNITNGLYETSYFLASTFMFILQIYIFKNLIDSIYILFNYKKNDFEIFSPNLTAINCRQFLLKLIILSFSTIISGFMSTFIYKLCLNYIIFYLCLLTLMVFLCNCIEPFSPSYLRPMKNILMFIVGLINFGICKFYFSKTNNSAFDINSGDMILIEKEEEDIIIYESSLYFVSDLFSLFCFDYLREYIDIQFEEILRFHKKLTKLDFIIFCFFISSFCIGILSIKKHEYISFLLSIYIAKLSLDYFIKIFNTKISRLICHSVIIFYIFAHLKLSSKTDTFLINFFSFTKINNKILSNIFSIISLLCLIIFVAKIYGYLYFSKECINNDELKELPEEQVNKILEFTSNISKQKLKNLKIQIIHDNNKYKMNNIFYISNDICLNHFEICIIFSIFNLNENNNNFVIKLLYVIFIFFFNSIKFFVINEIQNNIEYLSIFFISFMFTLRFLLLSLSYSIILYLICQINLLLLLIFYSINTNKKNKFISTIIVFHLFFELSQINSFLLAIDIIALIFSPIFKEYLSKQISNISKDVKNVKNGEQDYRCHLSFILFLFILIIFALQLYGIHNYNKILKYFNLNITNFKSVEKGNDDLDVINDRRKRIPIEFYIINEIISFLKIKE